MRRRGLILIACTVVLVAGPRSPCAAAPLYHVLNLGIADSAATGLNDRGQVIGQVEASVIESQGFVTQPNSPINLPTDYLEQNTAADHFSWALAINSLGQVTGYGVGGPTRWDPGPTPGSQAGVRLATSLPFPWDDGSGTAINEQGQVAGHAGGGGGFRTAPNSNINLATDRVQSQYVFGLNSLGQVVGQTGSAGNSQAYRTAANCPYNSATDGLGTLGGVNSSAAAINSSGQTVGWADTGLGPAPQPYFAAEHAFLSSPNGAAILALHDLGTLGGSVSQATAINELGNVVGFSLVPGDLTKHAFLYTGGAMLDVNNLTDNSIGDFVITSAAGINNHGQIAATGQHGVTIDGQFLPAGPSYALLLSPVPEPSSIALAAFGFVGLMAWGWRRRKH
jgi:probable HAF family extracellular repeat protein